MLKNMTNFISIRTLGRTMKEEFYQIFSKKLISRAEPNGQINHLVSYCAHFYRQSYSLFLLFDHFCTFGADVRAAQSPMFVQPQITLQVCSTSTDPTSDTQTQHHVWDICNLTFISKSRATTSTYSLSL